MSKKPADLSSGLVAVKGAAMPSSDMPARTGGISPPVPQPIVTVADAVPETIPSVTAKAKKEQNLAPLNFRVSAAFRRDFKTYAATHDLKLNELLRLSFDAYRQQKSD
jgi:hypothetical protein